MPKFFAQIEEVFEHKPVCGECSFCEDGYLGHCCRFTGNKVTPLFSSCGKNCPFTQGGRSNVDTDS